MRARSEGSVSRGWDPGLSLGALIRTFLMAGRFPKEGSGALITGLGKMMRATGLRRKGL